MTDAGWVRVATFGDATEARLVAGRLEAEGIPARIDPEILSDPYGQAATFLAQGIDVVVPAEQADEARTIVQRLRC